jgi:DNA-binding LacI/PurR family transcriptional regulator
VDAAARADTRPGLTVKAPKLTSLEIAQLAHVSQATVSRALRDSPLVKPETRERIQAIARELHYRTDRNAAGLRTRRSRTLALLLFEESPDEAQINPFFLSMIGHIARAAARRNFDLLMSFQQLSEDWHTDYELSNRADGMILLGYGDYLKYAERLRDLAETESHFVIWGPVIEGLPGHYVCCDNARGARLATEHLIARGRRRIAFVGSATNGSPEFQLRHRGFVEVLDAARLGPLPQLHAEAQSLEADGYRAGKSLLDAGVPFDAVFAASDLIAMGVIHALQDRGLSVPRDVAVVGFDDIVSAADFNPPLTTVRQDTRRASELLVENLICLIDDNRVDSTLIAPKLIVRASCGGRSAA